MPDKNNNITQNLIEVPAYFEQANDLFFCGKISDEFLLPIIESYIRYYAKGDGHTAKAKRNDLSHFIEFLAKGLKGPEKVLVLDWTRQKTQDFVDLRIKLGEAPATVSRRLATLKHLGRTLAERVPGFINPAREVKSPVFQTSKPQGLSEEEILALKEYLESKSDTYFDNFIELRNSLTLKFLLATGLRADEMRLLSRGQFSEDIGWIHHVKTKGKRFRDVYVPESLRPLIGLYLERSKQEIILKFADAASFSKKQWQSYPFLVSTHRASLYNPQSFTFAPKTLWSIIANFGKKIRLEQGDKFKHLHPHKLRHTFAHGLLDSTKDVRIVAQALGHSDVRTTMRYTERTKQELASAIEEKERIKPKNF